MHIMTLRASPISLVVLDTDTNTETVMNGALATTEFLTTKLTNLTRQGQIVTFLDDAVGPPGGFFDRRRAGIAWMHAGRKYYVLGFRTGYPTSYPWGVRNGVPYVSGRSGSVALGSYLPRKNVITNVSGPISVDTQSGKTYTVTVDETNVATPSYVITSLLTLSDGSSYRTSSYISKSSPALSNRQVTMGILPRLPAGPGTITFEIVPQISGDFSLPSDGITHHIHVT